MDSNSRFLRMILIMGMGVTAVIAVVFTLQSVPQTALAAPNGLTIAEWNDIQNQIMATISTTQQVKLTANDAAMDDNFGYAVAVDGETAVIGAAEDDDNGFNSGAVYIFTRSGTVWSQQAKLIAIDGATEDLFGNAVAIDGETAVIGAEGDDDSGINSGSVYIFTRSGTVWSQQAKLTISANVPGDNFGFSVAVDGETAVIGAPYNDNNGNSSGRAYIFTRSGTVWSQQATLHPNDPAMNKQFGYSVTIDGETAVIGAPQDETGFVYNGAAYAFVRSGTSWNQQAKLLATDRAGGDNFGNAVAIDGETAVIGALLTDDDGANSGSAYIFVRSGSAWSQQTKLTAADAAADDNFSNHSVAIDGDIVVIGSPYDDDGGLSSGSAYLFERTGIVWNQRAKLTATDAAVDDWLGLAVAIDGDTVIVGASRDDDGSTNSGSAYIFAAPPIANDDSYTRSEDDGLMVIPTAGVISNDNSGFPLNVTVDNDVSNGILTLDNDGGFSYTPTLNFNGTDNFSYILSNGVLTDTALVTITVNIAPVAVNDVYSTTSGITFPQPAPGVLSNDSDAELDELTAVLHSNVTHGTLILSSDGSFSYTSTDDFCGEDSFTYTTNDGLDDSNIATVTLNINCTIFLPMILK